MRFGRESKSMLVDYFDNDDDDSVAVAVAVAVAAVRRGTWHWAY